MPALTLTPLEQPALIARVCAGDSAIVLGPRDGFPRQDLFSPDWTPGGTGRPSRATSRSEDSLMVKWLYH